MNNLHDNDWQLQQEHYGPLWKYVSDDDITNVDWDSDQLWIKRAKSIKQKINDPDINTQTIKDFLGHVANHESCGFNKNETVLCAETKTLRITAIHDVFAVSGLSVNIRKSLDKLRFDAVEAIENKYCSSEIMHFLVNCIHSRINFTFCGEPGQGKTEATKFFSSFIKSHEKVITVEDVRELHYKKINPEKDCIELKTKSKDQYEKALSTALRMNPQWIMIGETRGREVKYLLESWSNGVASVTTLHVDDVKSIPDRIMNMLDSRMDAERIVNQIYDDVGLAVLLEEEEIDKNGNTRHKIQQVGYFERTEETNKCTLIVEEGVLYPERIPEKLKRKIIKKTHQKNIFFNEELEACLDEIMKGRMDENTNEK